jgi:hypothetical protein|eukprot:COSAG02_NODE_577_length_20095_cov_6.816413_18_plen_80_part_00
MTEVEEELLAMKQLSSGETDAKEDVVDQEAADAAIRLMFDFYDYDGGMTRILFKCSFVGHLSRMIQELALCDRWLREFV